jgi:zinc/manganese transport system permease protein
MMLQEVTDLVHVLGVPFLACVVMTGILGYLGLHVLKREIVFVDIALAQIVAVGAIGAHLLLGAGEDSLLAYASAFVLGVVAAGFYAVTRREVLEISTEAVIGVSYAIAAAGALFLLGVAPDGHAHAQHMLAGSILWATWNDVLVCGLAFLGVGICFFLLRKPFERISSDYDAAIREGMKVIWWDFLFYTLIGVVITFAVRIGGVVVVFCLLIIPATIAVMFSRDLLARLLIAWSAGVFGSLLGLLFAHRLDFSVGPAVALLLGVGLAVAGIWRCLGVGPAAVVTVLAVASYIALLLSAPSAARSVGKVAGGGAGIGVESVASRQADPVVGLPARNSENELQQTAGADGFAVLYGEAADSQSRCDVVLRAIDDDLPSSVILALWFLEDDPPLFFRQVVVDRLEEALDGSLDFDVARPFADPVNQKAAAGLREAYGPGE